MHVDDCCILFILLQVKEAESRLLHKLFPPNAWMRVHNFDVLTSCPKDELHQWFIGLYGEHIIPAIVHRYTTALQRPDLIRKDKHGVSHPLISNEALARVFRRLADRLQGVVTDTSMMTITPDFAPTFWRSISRRQTGLNLPATAFDFSC